MIDPVSRRSLLLGLPAVGAAAAWGGDSSEGLVSEAARQTPLAGECDVLVCGAGPAGMAAAITAARQGASVVLLEVHGCLGGVWTAGLLSYVLDSGKDGLNAEIIARLRELGASIREEKGADAARPLAWDSYIFDVEAMKFVLESMAAEAGIRVQLHTRVVAVEKRGRRVAGVLTESKSGRQAWRAGVVVDATGDGDVSALAGCDYEIGRGAGEADCPCQPMSLMGLVMAPGAMLRDLDHGRPGAKDRFRSDIERAGLSPSYAKPTLFPVAGPLAAVMLNHEYGARPDDAAAITAATLRARTELFGVCRALGKLPEWAGLRLVATAEQIGVRDGRRVRGRETVTVDDVVAGRERVDAVCRSNFCVDVHAMMKAEGKTSGYGSAGVKARPFDIPLAALIPADVDHLMTAGRCVSGDFFAHASYRVTGNAVAMGEAAGVTAALASDRGIAPHEVPAAEVTAGLTEVRGRAARS